MLEFIRERAQGVIAWIIVGAIILTFALFGINQYFSGGGDTSVAKVDGVEISQGQLQNAFLQQRQRLQDMFGGELPAMFTDEMLKSQVLQQLIQQQLLVQTAADSGMRISNQQLSDTITGIEAFQEDGKFSSTRYRQLLSAQGMSPGRFEQRVRRDLLTGQFTGTIAQSSIVTDAALNNYLRLQQQERTIGYLTVLKNKFSGGVSASDEEISNYYEQHGQEYMQPEQVKVDYLELKLDEMANAIEVADAALQERYETQKSSYSTPEQRKASHILIKVAENAPQEEIDAARAKVESLLARIKQGEDFAELAKAESQDVGSAKNGGDLDFFGRGAMVPPFEEAAFSLQKGEVSEPVRSQFGFHLIKLVDTKGGDVEPFDKVKGKIKKEIQTERAEQQYYDMAEQLANLTYEHPESLRVAAEQLSLPVKTSAFFSRNGGAGIAANPKVTAAAFSEEILERGNNSEAIELDRNHMVVLRLNEHKAAMMRPLEEVRGSIVSVLESDKAKAKAKELADAVLERIRAGEKPVELAEALGVEWSEQKTILREASDVDRSIVSAAFAMAHPGEGEPVSRSLALPSGDQAVLMLYRVQDGNAAEVDDKVRQQAQTKLQQAASRADESSVVEGIRSRADITIRQ